VKRLLISGVVVAAALAPASAGARVKVDVMVVGKHSVLAGPRHVAVPGRTVRVAGRRCAIASRTPLSALIATKLGLRYKDYGACSRRPSDAASLYVRSVAGERARGSDGWVYKVGHRTGSGGAADPAGAFGTGARLRRGADVLWFWCVQDMSGSCQRSLEVRPDGAVTPSAPMRVVVRGYDDNGDGVPVEGATVRLGEQVAVSGPDGSATLIAPASGSSSLTADKPGLVPSFPAEVHVS
jgi:hypothetical protein